MTILLYTYYHGIIDHSGINFKRFFWQPWQPDCIFHDNHHQYFHVNFGFNIEYWDKVRKERKDKVPPTRSSPRDAQSRSRNHGGTMFAHCQPGDVRPSLRLRPPRSQPNIQ